MKQIKKTAAKHFVNTLAVIVVLIGIISFFTATNTGLRWLTATATHIIPGKLEIAKVNGTLSGPVSLENITYKNTSLNLTIQKINFDWYLTSLLLNKIHLTKFNLQNADIKYNRPAKKNDTTLPKLRIPIPFTLRIDQGVLHNISWHYNDKQKLTLDDINLQANITPKKIKQLALEITAKNAYFSLQIKDHIDWLWQLHIANLAQFMPNAQGSIESNGKIKTFKNAIPLITVTNNINNLKLGGFKLTQLNNKIITEKTPQLANIFILNLRQLSTKQFTLPQLKIDGKFIADKQQKLLFLNLGATTINLAKPQQLSTIAIRGGSIKTIMDNQGLFAQGSLAFNKLPPLSAKFSLPKYRFPQLLRKNQRIRGSIDWRISNFDFLKQFATQIKNLSGKLQLQIKLAGTIAKPKLAAAITFENGTAEIPQLNLALHDIIFNINSKNNFINYNAQLKSGTGLLNLTGQMDYSSAILVSNGKIYGNNFLASDSKEYKIVISPQLQFKLAKNQLNVTGKVVIPHAKIKPTNFSGSLSMPPETTFVHQQKTYGQMGQTPITSKIQLVLGDDVYINVMDLKGRVTGQATISDTPQRDATATGKFTLKKGAYYNMYGQHLEVTEGHMFYNGGAVINPELYIKAIREIKNTVLPTTSKQIDKLIVGLQIKGYLDNLATILFSEPTGLATNDILSYLVLGQPSSEVSKDNTQVLFRVATALNFGGSSHAINNLINNLKHHLGLSELTLGTEKDVTAVAERGRIASEVTTHTALMLGKYLTPKIYIGYSLGLTESINIFRIRYYLSRKWSIQSESSSQGNGADVLYSIEKD